MCHFNFRQRQQQQQQQQQRALCLSDVRTALFFLLFINVSFFGTGNIASISSFELSST